MLSGLKPYPLYKDSGVPWLGEVPEHWNVTRGKWLLERKNRPCAETDQTVTCFRDGMVTLRSNRRETGFTQALKEIGYQGVRQGDLVIHAMDAFAGAVGVSESDGKCTPVYSVCAARSDADCRYYALVVREMARSQWILALSKGIRERSTDFRFETLGCEVLPVPPVSEQTSVVHFLDYAESRIRRYIRAKRRLVGLLEEQKQTAIHQAVTCGLRPGVALKKSAIPGWFMPAHWELRRLKYASGGVTVGVVVNPSSYFDDAGDIPMLLGNNLLPGRLSLDNVRKISAASNERLQKSQLHAGDLVVVRVGAPGVAAVVPPELEQANCASIIVVRKGKECRPRWLEAVFNSPVVRRQVDIVKYGAAQKQFNVSHAVEFLIPVPSLAEQDQILCALDRELTRIEPLIRVAESAIRTVSEYSSRLIADVVTGKLDVRSVATDLPHEIEQEEAYEEDALEEAGGLGDDSEAGVDLGEVDE
jgi:type I restriction enzyme, S subunit